jgi:sporulation protein YlmC with PRC-barrel domain
MTFRMTASGAALALMLGMTAAGAQQGPAPAPQPSTKTPVAGQMVTQPDETVLSSHVVGQTVYARDESKIGSISDLILTKDGKSVEGFVIGVGGFLGIGERNVALKMDQLKIAAQPDGSVKLTSDITKESLSNAPAFKSRKDIEAEKRAAARPSNDPPRRPVQ